MGLMGAKNNHRHADFQKSKWLIRFIFINQLPGRPLRYLQYDAGLFRTEPRKIHARIRKRKQGLTLSCKRDPELLRHFPRSGPWIARNK